MKTLKKILTGIYFILASLGVHSQSYIVYKDANHYTCIRDSDKEKLIQSESASKVIQFAVDQCQIKGGGEIILGKGFFELDTPIRLKDNIWLHGKRRGTELKLKKPNKTCIELIGANNVQISELTVTTGDNGNSLTGIYGVNSKNCKIQDAFIMGFVNSGLSFSGNSSGLIINRCIFIENNLVHIYLEAINDISKSTIGISNCTFFGGGCGIKTEKKDNATCGLKICDNIYSYQKGMAIDTDFDSVIISGNKLYWIESDGMRIKGKDFVISGNINSWIRGHGLVLDGAHKGIILGNNFTDLGVRYRDGMRKCGIAMYYSSQITISGNSIWNFGDQGHMEYAVYEDKSCSDNIIRANTGWFHAFPNAFKSSGAGTIVEDNTSNQGEYRGDYWDFTQKYGYAIEKYLKSLSLDNNYKPDPDPDTNTINIEGSKVIECKDMFGQVISIKEDTVKKFGWTGSELQVWNLRRSGDYSIIINDGTNQALECKGQMENSPVTLGKNDTSDSRLWKLLNVGNGYYKIVNKLSGKVLESQGLSNYNWKLNNVVYQGQMVTVSEYEGRESQIWRFIEPMPAYTYLEIAK